VHLQDKRTILRQYPLHGLKARNPPSLNVFEDPLSYCFYNVGQVCRFLVPLRGMREERI
jgi:hypothetical protein